MVLALTFQIVPLFSTPKRDRNFHSFVLTGDTTPSESSIVQGWEPKSSVNWAGDHASRNLLFNPVITRGILCSRNTRNSSERRRLDETRRMVPVICECLMAWDWMTIFRLSRVHVWSEMEVFIAWIRPCKVSSVNRDEGRKVDWSWVAVAMWHWKSLSSDLWSTR